MLISDNYNAIFNMFNTLKPRQNGRRFADEILKWIFVNENVWVPIKISPKFVPKGPINNIPALVQIMASRRPCDKPLSEPMMVRLTTHICVTRPQWVNMFKRFNINHLTLCAIQIYKINFYFWTSPPSPRIRMNMVICYILYGVMLFCIYEYKL